MTTTSIYYTTYYDNNHNCYKNILTINDLNNNLLKPYTKNIKINNISPFQPHNNKCIYAFIDSNNEFINLENISEFTNILNNINYSIDYETTKLLIDSKLIPNLVFVIKQN